MFNREIDVAEIMREIKRRAGVCEEDINTSEEPQIQEIETIRNELVRINDYIANTRQDSENYMEMGREIPVDPSRPYLIRKLLVLYKRLFRKSTRFLALDQKKYNEYVNMEIKALQESQVQEIRLVGSMAALKSENETLKKTNSRLEASLQRTGQLLDQVQENLSELHLTLKDELYQECMDSMNKNFQENRNELAELMESSLSNFFEHCRRTYVEQNHLDGKLYCNFEDQFRGNSEEIKKRLLIYVNKYIHTVIRNKSEEKILDLGCGRGEFLELLAEDGYSAIGVDINPDMVEVCKQKGLNAEASDLFEYLRGLPDNSIKVVTAFQVVEHISHAKLIELLQEVYRVLDFHGCLIFETPNCRNIEVGAGNFYSDPTHIRPVYPEYAEFLAKSNGYYETELFYWKQNDVDEWIDTVIASDTTPALESPVVRTLLESTKNLFYSSPDYALIAIK